MTYTLHITQHGWRIMRNGREVMGGAMADIGDARKAVRELNKEASHADL